MRLLQLVPNTTAIPFMRVRRGAFAFSALLMLCSVLAIAVNGLNFGIDFKGGTMIEVRTAEPADLSALRAQIGGLGLGDVSLQTFGDDRGVLIRVQQQKGDAQAQILAIDAIKNELGDGVEYRRVEFVGPKVGGELIRDGALAVILSLVGIMVYIWFRFEWQFGLCAVFALVHDIVATIGIFALLQLEFNLSTVAAILTIAGYSINDTVVVFDRVRETLRRFKSLPLIEMLDRAINDTLSRTTVTSLTTLLAVAALYFFGGDVIRDFAFALIWGVLIGTFSSIWVAVPLLVTTGIRPENVAGVAADEEPAGG